LLNFKLLFVNFKCIALITEEEIGKGNFGVVHKGKLMENGVEIIVAVKSVRPDATDAVFNDFLNELKTCTYVGNHVNVVRFIGGVTKNIAQRKLSHKSL